MNEFNSGLPVIFKSSDDKSSEITVQANGLSRTQSGGIQTSEGTLYVSKPFRAGKDKKSRAVISFVPRNSTFDPQDSRIPNEFRVRIEQSSYPIARQCTE